MIITTTSNIEGQRITQYLGIVSGETFLGANIFRDIGAAFRDIFGGRAKAYEASLREARELALTEMSEQASQMGANAIVGVKIDYESVETILMVTASGTAVKIG